MPSNLSIIFAGTPEFSVATLAALLRSSHRIVAVYTQPDRPAGRGRHVTMIAVKQCALRHGLPIEQPANLRDPAALQRLGGRGADLMVVVAYGLLLPETVLRTPRLGCINIHASLLPRWRGAAPIQRALLAGDRETGITIMQMDVGLDTGPMLLQRATQIGERETAGSLHDRLAGMGSETLLEAIDALTRDGASPRAQPAEGATYAPKILKQEALIDWSRTAAEIDRQVRAFNPWPVAETRCADRQLRIWESQLLDDSNTSAPGTVMRAGRDGIHVATASGALNLTRVQLAGGRAMSAAEFANAHRLDGTVLGS